MSALTISLALPSDGKLIALDKNIETTKVANDYFKIANQDKKIPIYGNGKNVRDWIYVEDHCDAVLSVLHHGTSGGSYNISANNEIDNLTIVRKILEIMNKPETLIEFVEDRPGHDLRYSLDSTKISDQLGWKVKSSFEEGLEKTVQWYLDNTELLNNVSSAVLDPTPWKGTN